MIKKAKYYYPYGLKHAGYGMTTTDQNAAYKYRYNSREYHDELDLNMTAMDFRLYDNILGRFFGMDALSENYHYISPYHFSNCNPVMFADPTGLMPQWLQDIWNLSGSGTTHWENTGNGSFVSNTGHVVSFIDSGGSGAGGGGSNSSFTYDYIFNQNGSYIGRELNNGSVNRLAIRNTETDETSYFHFADNVNDPKDILKGKIEKVVVISLDLIIEILTEKGGFDSENGGVFSFFKRSKAGGDFDFSVAIADKGYNSTDLFIIKGEKTAHNYYNFGNYLWGATGYSLGYSAFDLSMGAHLHSRYICNSWGSRQWDTKDDQLSIISGYNFARRNNFRKYVN